MPAAGIPRMGRQGIFIHSLWRSGSTWLFEQFRRSPAGYFCYQEPFHEALVQLDENPESLLGFSEETARSLRHPHLGHPYFQEFYDVREALRGKFRPCMSYEAFFDPSVCPGLEDYVQTLINAAPAAPVLQCCRSFGRVRHLREAHGGVHMLLWRDAVSQWFSYQINDYFDVVCLLVLNARNPPAPILALREKIGLSGCRTENFDSLYQSMRCFPLDMEQRYLIFYTLWLYSLLENHPQCDLDINLDRLTEDTSYAGLVTRSLASAGVNAVDLSSARSPVVFLEKSERQKFLVLERQVEEMFLDTGYSQQQVRDILEIRNSNRPRRRATVGALRNNLRQAREMAYRYADRLSESRGS